MENITRYGVLSFLPLSALVAASLPPIIPALSLSLNSDVKLIALSVTSYFLVASIAQGSIGFLLHHMNKRTVLWYVLVVYCIASLTCAFSNSGLEFVIARSLQGVIAAGAIVLRTAIIENYDDMRSAKIWSYATFTVAMGTIFSPLVSTIMVDKNSASLIFFTHFCLGLVAGTFLLLDDNLVKKNKIGLRDSSKRFSWSFIRQKRFWKYALIAMISTSIFYSYAASTAILISAKQELRPPIMGILFSLNPIGFAIGSILCAKLSSIRSSSELVSLGANVALCNMACLFAFSFFFVDNLFLFFFSMTIMGISNSLVIPMANLALLEDVENQSAAASVGSLVLNFGAAILSLISVSLVSTYPSILHFSGLLLALMVIVCSVEKSL